MIQGFRNQGTADIYAGEDTKAARKLLPTALHRLAGIRLDVLDEATSLESLGKAHRLHRLTKDRAGQMSLTISGAYRICFIWTEKGPTNVEIVDYH